jgi:hypothetical protein
LSASTSFSVSGPSRLAESVRQHTSAYVSIRQHTSAYVSIRQRTLSPGPLELAAQIVPRGSLECLPMPLFQRRIDDMRAQRHQCAVPLHALLHMRCECVVRKLLAAQRLLG